MHQEDQSSIWDPLEDLSPSGHHLKACSGWLVSEEPSGLLQALDTLLGDTAKLWHTWMCPPGGPGLTSAGSSVLEGSIHGPYHPSSPATVLPPTAKPFCQRLYLTNDFLWLNVKYQQKMDFRRISSDSCSSAGGQICL